MAPLCVRYAADLEDLRLVNAATLLILALPAVIYNLMLVPLLPLTSRWNKQSKHSHRDVFIFLLL